MCAEQDKRLMEHYLQFLLFVYTRLGVCEASAQHQVCVQPVCMLLTVCWPVAQVTIVTCGASVLVYMAFLLYLHLVKLGPSNIMG